MILTNAEIAIIGRPNVGKSTLFNKICDKKISIVHNLPGITRDIKKFKANTKKFSFYVLDTAGYDLFLQDQFNIERNEFMTSALIHKKSMEKTENAIHNSDLVLFVIDSTLNLTSVDMDIISFLRKNKSFKDVCVVMNKIDICDTDHLNSLKIELMKLGFEKFCEIFAISKNGISSLMNEIDIFFENEKNLQKILDKKKQIKLPNKIAELNFNSDIEVLDDHPDYLHINNKNETINNIKKDKELQKDEKHITLAIVGRPNAGKSSFFNAIFNEDKVIVSEEAGTTRDSISEIFAFNSKYSKIKKKIGNANIKFDLLNKESDKDDQYKIEVIDTAGIRKQKSVHDIIEHDALGQSITSIRRSDVVILFVDIVRGFEKQDMRLLDISIKEGKGIVIIFNKCDLISEKAIKDFKNYFKNLKNERFTNYKNYTDLYTSISQENNSFNLKIFSDSLREQKIEAKDVILENIVNIYNTRSVKLTTGKLNQILKDIIITSQAMSNGNFKLKYITQTSTKPQTFKVFTNIPPSKSYISFFTKKIIALLQFESVPVRINFVQTKNPYKK